MTLKGIEGLSVMDIQREVDNGGKFVYFPYCISILIMTFRRNSHIYFIKNGDNAFVKGLPYTLTSLALGWWGIPWGFIYTPGCLFRSISGGKDVTKELLTAMMKQTGGPMFDFETQDQQMN